MLFLVKKIVKDVSDKDAPPVLCMHNAQFLLTADLGNNIILFWNPKKDLKPPLMFLPSAHESLAAPSIPHSSQGFPVLKLRGGEARLEL